MIDNIYLIGIGTDIHLTRLQDEFRSRNIHAEILDPLANDAFHLQYNDEQSQFTVKIRLSSGTSIDTLKCSLMWHRVKVLPVPEPKTEIQQIEYLKLTETKSFWRNLSQISTAKFINDFEAIEYHRSKAAQLQIASKLGLQIAPTCISSNAKEITGFRRMFGDCLIKPLMTPRVPGTENVKPLSMHAIWISAEEYIDTQEFSAFPIIIQQYIEKTYELRIFVFANSVTAFKIDSQNSKEGKIDWRLAQTEDIFEEIRIPGILENKLIQYLQISGLDTGSFDFIVDKSGHYVFLECNPSGQWAWLEDPNNDYLPITRNIVDQIATGYTPISYLNAKSILNGEKCD